MPLEHVFMMGGVIGGVSALATRGGAHEEAIVFLLGYQGHAE
jgi:hypothetical protein